MITHFDHVAIVVQDWERALAQYAGLLGHGPDTAPPPLALGEQVAVFELSNARIVLLHRESAARLPEPVGEAHEGLVALGLATADGDDGCARLREGGLEPVPVPTGAASPRVWEVMRPGSPGFSDRMSVRVVERPGLVPKPQPGLADDQVEALDHVVIRSADPEQARALYGGALGIRLALDRELHGARMLFFRTGGVTIEVIADLGLAGGDVFYGLAYRVRDLGKTHARLAALGFGPSEPRPGRKAGTEVFSLRSAPCGVPTLFIRDPSRDR